MNFISKLFKKNVSEAEEAGKGSVEEFVSLIRVYYQAVMAVNLGITNLNMLVYLLDERRSVRFRHAQIPQLIQQFFHIRPKRFPPGSVGVRRTADEVTSR